MPKRNRSKQNLIDGATSFARKAEIYKAVLVEHGMPSDVIEALDSAIVAFRESIDSRGGARADYAVATRAVQQELALGRKIVTMLNGVLTRALHDQPAELAASATRRSMPSASRRSSTGEPFADRLHLSVTWRAASRVVRGTSSGQSVASASQAAATVGQSAAPVVRSGRTTQGLAA